MAKSLLRLSARKLRKEGQSIRAIAIKLNIPKSSISLWCRDIELSETQILKLLANKNAGIRRGQLAGALVQKNKRLEKMEEYKKLGLGQMSKLTEKELFMAGLALYLGEGSKTNRRAEITNADPRVIKFMIFWFNKFFNIAPNLMAPRILINEIHKNRDKIVRKFWSDNLKIPLSQFNKTFFVKSKQHKIYENHNIYYGTLTLRVSKSTDLCYKILGLINGLLNNFKETHYK